MFEKSNMRISKAEKQQRTLTIVWLIGSMGWFLQYDSLQNRGGNVKDKHIVKLTLTMVWNISWNSSFTR